MIKRIDKRLSNLSQKVTKLKNSTKQAECKSKRKSRSSKRNPRKKKIKKKAAVKIRRSARTTPRKPLPKNRNKKNSSRKAPKFESTIKTRRRTRNKIKSTIEDENKILQNLEIPLTN